jgi:cytochrome P450 family 4
MNVYLAITACGAALVLLFLKIWKFFRMWRKVSKIPGPPGIPILGNVLDFVPGDLAQNFRAVKQFMKYGRNVRAWCGPFPIILITDKDDVQRIMGHKQMENRGPMATKLLRDVCLNGLFCSEGSVWKRHRKIVQSTFHNNVLRNFVDNFAKNSLILTERLETAADGQSFDIFRYIGDCTFDVLFETAFAYNINVQRGGNTSLAKKILRINDILTQRCTNPLLLIDAIFKLTETSKEFAQLNDVIHGVVAKIIRERSDTLRESGRHVVRVEDAEDVQETKPVLLDVLLADGQLSEYDIRGELLTALLAGTETTATTCCYVLCALSDHQQVQQKVLEEQRHIFGEDFLRPVVADDVLRMVYLEQVIIVRLRTSINPMLSGKLLPGSRPEEMNGLFLPEEWRLLGCYAV